MLLWYKKAIFWLKSFATIEGPAKIFDYIVYPAVMYLAGFVWGFWILYMLAVPFKLATLAIYDRHERDVGIRQYAHYVCRDFSLLSILKKIFDSLGFVIFWIALSYKEPIYAVLLCRSKRGITIKTFFVLLLSTLIGYLLWGCMVGGITFGIKKYI